MAPPDSSKYSISLPTNVWGPIFWNTLHIVTLGYPVHPTEEDKMGARKFFESLQTVIPCPICREHYKSHLAEMPVDEALHSRSALIQWGWELHNRVNEMLGKPAISVDQFLDHIRSLNQPNKSSYKELSTTFVVGILVGAGAYVAYKSVAKK